MAFQFPWTNFHELNLDWFLSKFKQFTDNFLGTTATAESVPYGTQPSVTVTGGELDDDTDITDPFTFNFKIPAGQPGAQGEQGVPGVPGQDGFSPIATVTKNGDTATITITDANGTTTATVSDGASPIIDATPVENSTNAVSSGGMYDIINQDNSGLAYIQSTYRADRTYSAGVFFVSPDGILCKTTAYVANGGTLTEGTNFIKINSLGGALNNITTPVSTPVFDSANYTSNGINIIKIGNNLCVISARFTANNTLNSNNDLITNLPKTDTTIVIPVWDSTANAFVNSYISPTTNNTRWRMTSRTAGHTYSVTFAFICNLNTQY